MQWSGIDISSHFQEIDVSVTPQGLVKSFEKVVFLDMFSDTGSGGMVAKRGLTLAAFFRNYRLSIGCQDLWSRISHVRMGTQTVLSWSQVFLEIMKDGSMLGKCQFPFIVRLKVPADLRCCTARSC